jgi:hypothetical protein
MTKPDMIGKTFDLRRSEKKALELLRDRARDMFQRAGALMAEAEQLAKDASELQGQAIAETRVEVLERVGAPEDSTIRWIQKDGLPVAFTIVEKPPEQKELQHGEPEPAGETAKLKVLEPTASPA